MNKKITILAIICCCLTIFSCSDDSSDNSLNEDSNTTSSVISKEDILKMAVGTTYEIECKGRCSSGGCQLTNSGTPSEGNYAQCTCSSCSMQVTVTNEIGHSPLKKFDNKSKTYKTLMSLDLSNKEFNFYMNKNHKGMSNYKFSKMAIGIIKGGYYLQYFFELTHEGNSEIHEESVMYLHKDSGTNKGETKKYEVDCKGSCGCREMFNFETNSAECSSCTACKMTVTELTDEIGAGVN